MILDKSREKKFKQYLHNVGEEENGWITLEHRVHVNPLSIIKLGTD